MLTISQLKTDQLCVNNLYFHPLCRKTGDTPLIVGSLFEGKQLDIKHVEPVCSVPRIVHMSTFDHLKVSDPKTSKCV
jgi:hypothetical protein